MIAFALFVSQAGEPSCRTADARVEDLISSTARRLKGHEYCQFRLYRTIDDVDGDRQADFLVVFAVEGLGGGGNNSKQFLGVFPSSGGWRPIIKEVGQRGLRVITEITIKENHEILLATLEYLKSDALCCPTGKGELRVRVQGRELIER